MKSQMTGTQKILLKGDWSWHICPSLSDWSHINDLSNKDDVSSSLLSKKISCWGDSSSSDVTQCSSLRFEFFML